MCLATRAARNELYEYGAQQVALYSRLIQEVVAVIAKEAGLGAATTRDVVNHLAKDAPRNDDELFAWYRETAARAVAYGREHRMFDVPADYKLDILPTPPVLQNSLDAAYYMAPPFKKSGVGRFYLSPTNNDPARLRLKKRASIADTAIHEGFPGHDWHFKYMTQHAAADLQHPVAHPGRSRGLIVDVERLAGGRRVGAVCGRADGRTGGEPPVRLLYARGVSLRAAGTDDAGCQSARRRRHSHRADDLQRGARLLRGTRRALSRGVRPDRPGCARGVRHGRARDLPLLEVADAGDCVQPGQERDHLSARGVQKKMGTAYSPEPSTKGSCEWERCPSSFSATVF